MSKNPAKKRQIQSATHSLSDVQVLSKFLHDLQKVGDGGLVPSQVVELNEMAERLKIIRQRAVRKLKEEGHGYTEMAIEVGTHTNAVIEIAEPQVRG